MNQALKESNEQSLQYAIAKAKKELRDGNDHSANYILQTWLSVNEDLLADLAFEIAKFHIGHAVPDPADHLKNARRLLDLARSLPLGVRKSATYGCSSTISMKHYRNR